MNSPSPPPDGSADIDPAWAPVLNDAIRALGAPEGIAAEFAQTGRFLLDGVVFEVRRMCEEEPAPRCVVAGLQRPAGVGDERWYQALLVGTRHTMLLGNGAFGIDDDGIARMLVNLPPASWFDATALARELGFARTFCTSLLDAVRLSEEGDRHHG